jgi:hypothetical protein
LSKHCPALATVRVQKEQGGAVTLSLDLACKKADPLPNDLHCLVAHKNQYKPASVKPE